MSKQYSVDRLQKAVVHYLEEHPKAQDPFDYLMNYRVKGLTDLVENCNGREIVFTQDKNVFNRVTAKYK